MVRDPANATSIQSGEAYGVPSFHPPPLPQLSPRRSPLMAPDAGYFVLYVDDAVATPPLAASATFTPGGRGEIVTCTGADVVLAPSSSTAIAVSVYVPAATPFHGTLYGAVSSTPINTPFA